MTTRNKELDDGLTVDRSPIVPDSRSARGPGPTHLNIDTPFEDIVEVLEDRIGLSLLEAVDAASQVLVNEERLPTGDTKAVKASLDASKLLEIHLLTGGCE